MTVSPTSRVCASAGLTAVVSVRAVEPSASVRTSAIVKSVNETLPVLVTSIV